MFRLWLIDLLRRTQICNVLKELQVQQYLDKAELDKMRNGKLERLFKIAQRSTNYYSRFKSYDEVAVLTKKVIREHTNDFISFEYRQKIFRKETGGSTGVPLVYFTTSLVQSFMWASIILAWETAGYKPGDKVAMVAGSSVVKTSWRHDLFYRLLNIKVYSTNALDDQHVRAHISGINRSKAKIIYGYANAIGVLADFIEKNGPIQFPHLQGIVTTAEVLTDPVRKNIEKAFGVKVFNQYGCNEAGVSAFECEHHSMHLISSRCIYEIGHNNHLIATDLCNDAFIMMKYDTGDIVELVDEANCPCNRTYPVIKQIVGRSNDLVIDANNKIMHSAFFGYLFRKDSNIKQYQILFDNENIIINLKVDNVEGPDDCSKYLEIVKSHLAFKDYKIVINAPFFTTENAKHKYVINNRN